MTAIPGGTRIFLRAESRNQGAANSFARVLEISLCADPFVPRSAPSELRLALANRAGLRIIHLAE